MPHIIQKNKLAITTAILIVGSFFLFSAHPAHAFLNSYSKPWDGTLSATEWNNLASDFLNKSGAATMTGPLGINTSAPASGLEVNGPIVGTSYGGSMGAGNISSGAFGSNTGGGNYSFPGFVGIGTTSPAYALDVVGDINLTGSLLYNGSPLSSSQWSTNGLAIYYNTGNVGIGTSAPGSRLTVSGGDLQIDHNRSLIVNSNLNTTLLLGNYYDAQGFGYGTSTTYTASLAIEGDVKGNRFCIKEDCKAAWTDIVAAGGGGQWTINGSDMYNANSGNIGIGVTNPNNKLQVVGLINFNNTDFNTLVGKEAGLNLVTGAQFNTFFGYEAGRSATSGSTVDADYNTALGYRALASNSVGAQNTAVGSEALASNTTGDWNTAFGESALMDNTIGYSNMAFGSYALKANTTGNNNSAIGTAALRWNTTGESNVANGNFALHDNTTGSWNMAIGLNALHHNSTGTDNVAIGADALNANTTGSYNVANGSLALTSNTTGDYNIALGYDALYYNTTGSDNVVLGADAMPFNTTGSRNIAIGSLALNDLNIINSTSSYNTAIGYDTGRGIVTGTNNTIIGSQVTGLDAALSNNIIIADGAGNRRINVDALGNVGIGTTNPTTKLYVTGSLLNTLATTHSLLGGAGNVLVMADNTGTLYSTTTSAIITPIVTSASGWTANGTTVYKTDTSGNVGIGTTNPAQKLSVAGNISLNDVASSGNRYIYLDYNSSTWPNYSSYIAQTGGNDIAGTRGLIINENIGQSVSNYGINFAISSSSKMFIQYTGNVGIGTTTPTEKLEVSGDIKFNEWITNGGAAVIFTSGGVHSSLDIYQANGTTIGSKIRSSGASYFNGGNVGIGTTNPSSFLHIYMNNASEHTLLTLQNASNWTTGQGHDIAWKDWTAVTGAIGFTYSSTTDSSDFRIHSQYNGNWTNSSTVNFIVKGNGNVGIGTTAPTTKLYVAGSSLNTLATTHSLLGGAGNVLVMSDNTGTLYSTTTSSFISGNSLDLWEGTKNGNIYNGDAGAGNVGIGTTTPAAKLSVSGQIRATGGGESIFKSGSDTSFIGLMLTRTLEGSSADWEIGIAGASGHFSSTSVQGDAVNRYKNNYLFSNMDTERMRITASGNVGIGTTTPGAKLDIGAADSSNVNTGLNITRLATAGNMMGIKLKSNASGEYYGALTYKPGSGSETEMITFGTQTAADRVLFNSGNVGIGTTTPSSLLHVYKSANNLTSSLILENANPSGSIGDVSLKLKTRSSNFNLFADDDTNFLA